ncbi:MAG: GntR family transcriptional regulator [Terracidiphilus sp.]
MDATANKPQETKYMQIYESLKNSISTGVYKSGQRLPSEVALGEQFQASRITVAKALAELRDQGLITRKAGSGSYVSSGPSEKRMVFGLIIPELGRTEIFEPICQAIANTQPEREHSLMWGSALNENPREEQVMSLARQYLSNKVDGVFFAPLVLTREGDAVDQAIAEMFFKARIPLILLDRDITRFPSRSNFDLIGIDNRRAGFVLTEHLIQQGCKRIQFVGRPNYASSVDARIAGYREGIRSNQQVVFEEGIWQIQPTDIDVVRELYFRDKPDGLVCDNDFTAASLMSTLLGLGIRIPEDLRMVGVDDVKYASLLQVPLTTFHQPCRDLGEAAIRAMFERVRHPEAAPREILLKGRLVIRKSSAAKSA